MSRNELAAIIEQLGEYQVEQIRMMAEGFLSLNEKLNDTPPKGCPCCKSTTACFIKKGFSGRKQRYQCVTCKKKFTYTVFSHLSAEKWVLFIEDTLSMKTLDQCAENISVSHVTSFYMRQNLLAFLEESAKQGNLPDGMIEADETYIQESQKGIRVNTRKARNHGEPAEKRGLSNELMCVCVAADRNGNVTDRCVNRARKTFGVWDIISYRTVVRKSRLGFTLAGIQLRRCLYEDRFDTNVRSCLSLRTTNCESHIIRARMIIHQDIVLKQLTFQ